MIELLQKWRYFFHHFVSVERLLMSSLLTPVAFSRFFAAVVTASAAGLFLEEDESIIHRVKTLGL